MVQMVHSDCSKYIIINLKINNFKDTFPQRLKLFAISVTNTGLVQRVSTKVITFRYGRGTGGLPPRSRRIFLKKANGIKAFPLT